MVAHILSIHPEMHKKAEKKPLNSISIVWLLILVVHITLLLIKYIFSCKKILIVNTNN